MAKPAGTREERFERLFVESYDAVFAYALRRAPREVAEDAVAETFLVAWRRLDEVPTLQTPWLLGTARRVLANQRRAELRRRRFADRLTRELPPLGNDEPVADRPLAAALATLSPNDRELILLVAWDDLTPAQAAEALGWSRPRLAVRLHRARRRLAAALEYRRIAAAAPSSQKEAIDA